MTELEAKIIKMHLGKNKKTKEELEKERQEYNELVKRRYGIKKGKK